MEKTIRVTVRGVFDNLTAQQQAELVAAGAEHDFLNTRYTAEGYLAYDLPGRPFFTFRFEERVDGERAEEAVARAEQKAAAWMRERGYPVKNLTSQAVDMSEVPLGKRGRREARRR